MNLLGNSSRSSSLLGLIQIPTHKNVNNQNSLNEEFEVMHFTNKQKAYNFVNGIQTICLVIASELDFINNWDKSEMNYLHLYLKIFIDFQNRDQAKEDF